jgi:hypothetical protein
MSSTFIVAELTNLANGCAASGDSLGANICADAIAEIERKNAIIDELRKLACDWCSQDCPFDGPGHHIEGDCDAWTDTEAEAAKGSDDV